MQSQIYPQVWINVPNKYRNVLVKVFSITRTGVTEIRDQEVVSDGYTADDLKAITLEKMNEYIGSVETFGRAWELVLAKVHAELNPPVGEIKRHVPEEKNAKVEELFTKPEHHNAKKAKSE